MVKSKKSTTLASRVAVDRLSCLPHEVMHMILDYIEDPSTVGKFGRTCKKYYAIMMPLLHKRVAVAAMFHAHISKLIRGLEPYLTIAQKKQLKKEGKYKGQQERFPSHLDANAKPGCGLYVQQMIVGVSSPGKKHDYIVHRYVEEAFKNLSNLQVVEAYFLTRSMAQSIASLRNLQALRLLLKEDSADEAMQSLAQIKNLRHFSVQDSNYNKKNILQTIILNSASSLRSLDVKTNQYATNFLQDWERNIATNDNLAKCKHTLSVLKSLTICGFAIDSSIVRSLSKAFDLMGLYDLGIGHIAAGKHLLFQHLTNLATSLPEGSTSVCLRSLCMEMSEYNSWNVMDTESSANFEAICDFISSFNTLTTLELKNYNQYPDTIITNPGLPTMLSQAILQHKNLKSLKISYIGITGGRKTPYLSASTVAAITNGLHRLEFFEFAPDEAEINAIGKALSHGFNLQSVTCFPFDSWASYPPSDEPGLNILTSIINGFLSREIGINPNKFVWEDHFKLHHVSVGARRWEIASKLGKRKKGMDKEKKLQNVDSKREVLYRDITQTTPVQIHIGYDPNFTWVGEVAVDIN